MQRRSTRLSAKAAPSETPTPSSRVSTSTSTPTPSTTTSSTPKTKPKPKHTSKTKISKPTQDPETIYFPSPTAFNTFLLANATTIPSGIWLKIAKKASSIPTVSYDEAIDTALCHGWIDGQRKTFDENYFIQRFTPRRKNSLWSKRNVDKVSVLTDQGRMQETGLGEVQRAKDDGRWDRAYAGPATMEVPDDFAEALRANTMAGEVFAGLDRGARYSMLWRVTTAKKEETRRRKIEQFVDMLARGETL